MSVLDARRVSSPWVRAWEVVFPAKTLSNETEERGGRKVQKMGSKNWFVQGRCSSWGVGHGHIGSSLPRQLAACSSAQSQWKGEQEKHGGLSNVSITAPGRGPQTPAAFPCLQPSFPPPSWDGGTWSCGEGEATWGPAECIESYHWHAGFPSLVGFLAHPGAGKLQCIIAHPSWKSFHKILLVLVSQLCPIATCLPECCGLLGVGMHQAAGWRGSGSYHSTLKVDKDPSNLQAHPIMPADRVPVYQVLNSSDMVTPPPPLETHHMVPIPLGAVGSVWDGARERQWDGGEMLGETPCASPSNVGLSNVGVSP